MIRIMTWNLLDLFLDSARETRVEAIAEVLKYADPDMVCVQEIRGHHPEDSLARLANAAGLDCAAVPGSTPWNEDGDVWPAKRAIAVGDADFHVGIMWRHGIVPVPGTWRQVGRATGGLWHAAASIGLDVGAAVPLWLVNCHLDPFRPEMRFSEAARIVSLTGGKTAVVCGDFNGISSERRADGTFYDPDPLVERSWHEAALFQAAWDDDPDAPLRTDRRAAERLRRAGLADVACALDAPWQATTGHWPADPHGPRRIDRILATAGAVPALRSYQVLDNQRWRGLSDFSEQGRQQIRIEELSDHLPVVVELDETILR